MKKYFYVALAAAMTAFSASTFTSCKDTDDITNERLTHAKDVKNLQNQIDQAKLDHATKTELKDAIAGLEESTTERRNALIDSIKNVLRNYVTGIRINEVKNNAFGSYNGFFTNLQTTCMIGYYGEDGDANPIPETIDLGQINFSINPAGADYTGQKMYLINSLGEKSVIALSPAAKAEEVLMSGITRGDEEPADTIYSYVTNATIALADCDPIKLDLNKSNLKAQLEKLNNANGAKPALQSIASIVNQVINALSVPRLGVKTIFEYEWYDDVVKNAQVTGFDVTAVAVKPLGFGAYEFKGVPGYSIVKKAAEKVYDKILEKVRTQLADQLEGSALVAKMNKIAGYLHEIKFVDDAEGKYVHEFTPEECAQFGIASGTIDITKEVNKLFIEINKDLKDMNAAFASVQDMVDEINRLIKSIRTTTKFDSAKDKVFDVLDSYNEKIAAKMNLLFEPVLLVSSADGTLSRAGLKNVPAVVKAPATLYPTTYSAEILTPIYEKTVTVNGEPAEIVNGKVILDEPGEYTVEYTAQDYCGHIVPETYHVTVK